MYSKIMPVKILFLIWETINAVTMGIECYTIEWFSIECRKTKTKVITLANHSRHKQHNEPIRIQSKYMHPAPSAGKHMRASERGTGLVLVLQSLVEKVTRVLSTNHKA